MSSISSAAACGSCTFSVGAWSAVAAVEVDNGMIFNFLGKDRVATSSSGMEQLQHVQTSGAD